MTKTYRFELAKSLGASEEFEFENDEDPAEALTDWVLNQVDHWMVEVSP